MPSPFYPTNVSTFPASWGHGQSYAKVLATLFSIVHNTKYLDPYLGNHTSFSCLFLGCDVGMYIASGAHRHLDITFISDCR